MARFDEVNQATWSQGSTLESFEHTEGWSDPGEQMAFKELADEVRDQPVLDLGVGAGRTTPLLMALSSDYVGLDYLAPMVERCRAKHPDARIEHGDARDLSRFDDRAFGFVNFSANGIDAVDHEDRQCILNEVHRVLRPGGVFLFSTHNQQGPGHAEKPWGRRGATLRRPRNLAWRMVHLPGELRGYHAHRGLEDEHGTWSMRVAAAHDFGIVIHYTTLDRQRAELVEHGFDPSPVVYESDTGRRLGEHEATTDAFWMHLIARPVDR